MRKGFTMIELIFVIVILGILAAVAIPRLNATRDDAEISKGASNLATLMSDLSGYYTSKGSFDAPAAAGAAAGAAAVKWKDVTNVAMASTAAGADIGDVVVTTAAFLKVKDKGCVSLQVKDGSKVEVKVKAQADGICDQFKAIKSVQTIAGDGTAVKIHDFGGSQVKF